MIHNSSGTITESSSTETTSWPPQVTGSGFILTGSVQQLRNHTMILKKKPKDDFHRYVVVAVDIEYAKKRIFDSKGEEIENTNLDSKESKGHLNHFNKIKGTDKEKVDYDTLRSTFGPPFYDKTQQHPQKLGRFEFLGESNMIKGMNLLKNDKIKFKTKGDSVLLEVCTKEDQRAHNFHGENVLDTFANKISKGKEVEEKPLSTDNMEGVDSDEWDD